MSFVKFVLVFSFVAACEEPDGDRYHWHGDTANRTTSVDEPGDVPCGGELLFSAEWTDDGATPTDTDGDGVPDSGCGDALEVSLCDPAEVEHWTFGMAETGTADGSRAEDCLGDGLCHEPQSPGTWQIAQSCDPTELASGTTLVDASRESGLTYVLHDGRFCFTWGHDPAYYEGFGCAAMVP